jgi:hypothetical protein
MFFTMPPSSTPDTWLLVMVWFVGPPTEPASLEPLQPPSVEGCAVVRYSASSFSELKRRSVPAGEGVDLVCIGSTEGNCSTEVDCPLHATAVANTITAPYFVIMAR